MGIGYSIALRVAVSIIVSLTLAGLLLTGLLHRGSVAQFSAEGRTAVERIVDLSAMQHDRAYFWLTVTIASFVVAGLREELWRSGTLAAMRALWPTLFEGRDGQIAGVALSAIIFGLAHLTLGLLPAAMAIIASVLAGTEPSSKFDKTKELRIKIIDEAAFWKIYLADTPSRQGVWSASELSESGIA